MPIAGWGFAPALAAGNTVVLKPAELTPLTAIRLASSRSRRGSPRTCSRCSPARARSSGSASSTTRTLRKIVSPARPRSAAGDGAAAPRRSSRSRWSSAARAPTSSSPTPTWSRPRRRAPYGVFDNAGQDCCARSRILVQRSVFDRFMELFEPAVRGVVVADPADERPEMGPLISAGAPGPGGGLRRRRRAGRVPRLGAGRAGLLVPADGADADRPEPTGCCTRRSSDRSSRSSPSTTRRTPSGSPTTATFGLSGSIWTRDLGRALRVSRGGRGRQPVGQLALLGAVLDAVRRLQASGLGRELGPDAPLAFTETKNVFIATD